MYEPEKFMKSPYTLFYPAILILLLSYACEKHESTGLVIKFSDGTSITEENIDFYDSSTCILFLRDILHMEYVLGEIPDVTFTSFSVIVDDEVIYKGVVYPDLVAAPAPEPFYIAGASYPEFNSKILQIRHQPFFTETADARNDYRIINRLKKTGLLYNGISCRIDTVYLSQDDPSVAICNFTVMNLDEIGYYIPDPDKMGEGHFNYYTGGLALINSESDDYYFPRHDNPTVEWNYLEMDDLSMINGLSDTSFLIYTPYDSVVPDGTYTCLLRYGILRHFYTISLPLELDHGRVWVGGTEVQREFGLLSE